MLHIQLLDENGVPCCANVGAYRDGERVWRAYVGEAGELPLADGVYRLVIQRGKQYWPVEREVAVQGQTALTVRLERVCDPKRLGFYAFDAHSHISRARYGADAVMDLETMSVRARGEDWNVYFAGTPYDGENHLHVLRGHCPPIESYRKHYQALLERLARPDYRVDPGGELVKYRYGHIVLANFESVPPVNAFRDPLYHAFEQERNTPCVQPPPFENLPPSRAVRAFRNPNSFAFFAHPTSWWRQPRTEGFVTNIASSAAFDGLTGMVDAIVVMGYGADKPWYREVWYALLNAGYRMTGVAETDTCADDPDHLSGKRMVEPYRTYARCGALDLDALSAAVRAGDCFASSGPLLDYTLDQARPGSVLAHDPSRTYALSLRGWPCCEGALCEFEIVVNGQTYARVSPDARGEAALSIWLPLEGYVLAIARDKAGNVAVGNPVYVRNQPFVNEGFRSHVVIEVTRDGRGANGAFRTDEGGDPITFDTRVICEVNPMSRVYVTVQGETRVYEPFFDEELQAHFRYAYSGEFLRDFPDCGPGEVPAQAFRIPEILARARRLTARMDFGVSDEALAGFRAAHKHKTGRASLLVAASPFPGLQADDRRLPDRAAFSTDVPQLVWAGHEDACGAMARAFEILHAKIMRPEKQSGLPRRLVYTEFADAFFMWGICFVSMFGEYAAHLFPFAEMLDNFYAKQHPDGFICRQIDMHTGQDQFERHDPSSTGPNILALAEWRHFLATGDRERLARVYGPLLAFHRWLRKHRTWQNGGYFSSGWGSGMDNVPRFASEEYSPQFDTGHLCWIDTTAQQALNARMLLNIAEVCGIEAGREELAREYVDLEQLINTRMWNDRDGCYQDTDRQGRTTGVLHIGAYWTLLAGVVPEGRLKRFVAHLEDPQALRAPMGTRSLSASHPDFQPNGGDYWRGGIWSPTEYMLFLGLSQAGYGQLAHTISRRHVEAVAQVYARTGTFWESYDPVTLAPGRLDGRLVRNEFVGFTGLSPIAMALEGVLGLNVGPDAVEWRIRCAEDHGVRQLRVGGHPVDLLYADGLVTVRCEAPLRLMLNGERYALSEGTHRIRINA